MPNNEPQGNTFYVPQRIHVQLGATDDNPAGGVVTLEQGWHENIDDDRILNNPVIMRLRSQSESEEKRRGERADMERRLANGDAKPHEYQEMLQEQNAAEIEERQAAADEWNQRAGEAADRGVVFDEPHPDREVERARALTAQPAHAYSAAALAQKPQSQTEPKQTREALEDNEGNNSGRGRRRQQQPQRERLVEEKDEE